MPQQRIRTFTVQPYLPERLRPLQTLAYDMWWSWHHDAVALFRRIDEDLFERVEHSPVKLLGAVEQSRLEWLAQDEGFLAHMDRVAAAAELYRRGSTWYEETYGERAAGRQGNGQSNGHPQAATYAHTPAFGAPGFRIGYFSAEFGLHESVPVYSGGLGVLAGDHLKSASDLGLPLVGVGLMYRLGYFRQYLNQDGWQQERYPENDFFNLPLVAELGPDQKPLIVRVPLPNRDVVVRVWRIQVGRVPLYLLDTNVPDNSAEDRELTGQLYGGDHDMRIRQEMILGIGGIRMLQALKLAPSVCHMNEGHSAFLGLERIRTLMLEQKLTFDEAREAVAAGSVFTTHTPVPAGIDLFAPTLVEHYLGSYLPLLGIDRHQLLGLGRQNPSDHNEPFSMAVLALRLANVCNGVSELHGKVSRKMWRGLWPELPEADIPIASITNGIHTQSWLSREMNLLFERYLGLSWLDQPTDYGVWKRIENVPDAELWRTHERRRERLVVFARGRVKWQLRRRGAPPAEINRADEVLDPEALTIGFARRFATYKRGTLIFRNLERLAQLVNHKDRPVQIIFAGKAHPRDHGGKELIAEIVHTARRPEFRRRIVFLEDYDINVARSLVQGVDVWLNNPRRPLEASGTSGMKVAANGGLNLSVLDGWWCEGYAQDNGWAIGAGEEYTDLSYQDEIESRAIYDLLEQEIVPLFYNRGSDGLPRGWLRMMKRSLQTIAPFFNTNRMVQQYAETSYWPSHVRFSQLMADNTQIARVLAAWRKRLERSWNHIRVEGVEARAGESVLVGRDLEVHARVHLGLLTPDDVEVQLYHGRVDSRGEIATPEAITMAAEGGGGPTFVFSGAIPCRASGQHGYTVRILPKHAALANPFMTGLVCWG
jgi:starch phosphorylase